MHYRIAKKKGTGRFFGQTVFVLRASAIEKAPRPLFSTGHLTAFG